MMVTTPARENVSTFLEVGRRTRNQNKERAAGAPLLKDTPDGEPVVAIVVIRRIHIGRIDVQVVHIVSIVERRRPEVAVRPLIVRRAIVEVTRERRAQGVTWGYSKNGYKLMVSLRFKK